MKKFNVRWQHTNTFESVVEANSEKEAAAEVRSKYDMIRATFINRDFAGVIDISQMKVVFEKGNFRILRKQNNSFIVEKLNNQDEWVEIDDSGCTEIYRQAFMSVLKNDH